MKVICLCGSEERFGDTIQRVAQQYRDKGHLVLLPELCNSKISIVGYSADDLEKLHAVLHQIHLEKVAQADEVHVINMYGYVGLWTAKEVVLAQQLGKPITWFVPKGVGSDHPAYLTEESIKNLQDAGYLGLPQIQRSRSYVYVGDVRENDLQVALFTGITTSHETVTIRTHHAADFVCGKHYTISIQDASSGDD